MLINYKPTGKNRWTVRENGRKVGTIKKLRGSVIVQVPIRLLDAVRVFAEQVG